jgi:hypothetical protein
VTKTKRPAANPNPEPPAPADTEPPAPADAAAAVGPRVEEIEQEQPLEAAQPVEAAPLQPPAPPLRPQRPAGTFQGRRGQTIVAASAVVAVIVLAGAAILLPQLAGQSSPSGSPVAEATASPTGAASAWTWSTSQPGSASSPAEEWTEEWTEEPEPSVDARGWPVTMFESTSEGTVVGPDGTVYSWGAPALDRTGHARKAWMLLPDGEQAFPEAFGSDGSAYALVEGGEGEGEYVWAFGPDGAPRYHFELTTETEPDLAAGPSGSLYVLAFGVEDASDLEVTIVDASGKTTADWTIHNASGNWLLRPDGTMLVEVGDEDACRLHVFDAHGHDLSTSPGPCWDYMVLADDGRVAGWSYDWVELGDTYDISATSIALLGADGKAAAGWPQHLDAIASGPAFGPDGRIYVSEYHQSPDWSKVVAFDSAGNVPAGWPVTLADSAFVPGAPAMESGTPLPPVLGGGVVYVAGDSSVSAFDSTGATVAGWPYHLPASWSDFLAGDVTDATADNPGPLYVSSGSGSGLLYLALEDQLVALDSGARVAAGWPYRPGSDFLCWRELLAAPDGGVVVFAGFSTEDEEYGQIMRFTPDGKFAK